MVKLTINWSKTALKQRREIFYTGIKEMETLFIQRNYYILLIQDCKYWKIILQLLKKLSLTKLEKLQWGILAFFTNRIKTRLE